MSVRARGRAQPVKACWAVPVFGTNLASPCIHLTCHTGFTEAMQRASSRACRCRNWQTLRMATSCMGQAIQCPLARQTVSINVFCLPHTAAAGCQVTGRCVCLPHTAAAGCQVTGTCANGIATPSLGTWLPSASRGSCALMKIQK